MNIILATKNEAKIKEIRQILNNDIKFKTYKDFTNWPNIEETGTTFKENALLKAKTLAKKFKMASIADDSGLVVEALNGRPGVFSSRYAGNNANDEQNTIKLLSDLNNISDRRAAFVTIAVYFDLNKNIIFTEGRIDGTITNEPRGDNGFGYDPVFKPRNHTKTFAEMTFAEKNELSHRGKAFKKLKKELESKKL